jgi:hypothetical protein
MTIGLQRREDLKSGLARYVSEDILNEIIYAGKSSGLYSQRKKVTALSPMCGDLQIFPEQLSPEETVMMLNDYFREDDRRRFQDFRTSQQIHGGRSDGALCDDDFQEAAAFLWTERGRFLLRARAKAFAPTQ